MVSLDNISFSYTVRGNPIPVFEHFSAYFEQERITAVIGPSGCGKTTLLRLIAGLLSPQGGSIQTQRSRIGFIFQDFGLLPWLTVERNAGLGLEALGIPAEERRRRVCDILEELGLSQWRKVYPVRLSGGMQQRVSVARALAIEADLILMDEPFSSLDALTRESVQDMLRTIQRAHHTTIVLVTHSIEEGGVSGRRYPRPRRQHAGTRLYGGAQSPRVGTGAEQAGYSSTKAADTRRRGGGSGLSGSISFRSGPFRSGPFDAIFPWFL